MCLVDDWVTLLEEVDDALLGSNIRVNCNDFTAHAAILGGDIDFRRGAFDLLNAAPTDDDFVPIDCESTGHILADS